MSDITRPKKAIIIGGSLGGLFAGNMMRKAGWDVDIFERSAKNLDSQGGGIVLQPQVVEVIQESGVNKKWDEMGVRSQYRIFYNPDGMVEYKQLAPQMQTSWSLIYSTLLTTTGKENYHQGKKLQRIDSQKEGVTAWFEDGSHIKGDILIGADGNNSTVRQLLWPGETPTYSGYIAWRGLIREDRLPDRAHLDLHGNFAFAENKGSQILGYLVPGINNDLRPGHRLYNWVWYRVMDDATRESVMTDKNGLMRGHSLPEGVIAQKWKSHIYEEASRMLPPGFRDVVLATEEPFAQSIRDLAVDRMVKERVLLLGDAASIPRPHTAASTSKAAANALALRWAFLNYPDDIDAALARWEPEQRHLGKYLKQVGMNMGNRLMSIDMSPSSGY
ncbi:2-polyprenyl-6-methoxyphenol hydroxylase-like FAD-dependent oxidoreductase [Raoultella ornithinolytica]|uniref:2-polyprenyl-6-methoxyphenol hydroxylase-like FAD-dependent oxidoreductase n=1 Tax=Raoultella ornithinolytica TaxID=54291 RepID=A0ABD7QK66_RAOOR|nr:2-polyprenyl-6-methoxyphenol hydroxylase-like FAD-dependent oxidoreductase [Raoultella ornithinolytica]